MTIPAPLPAADPRLTVQYGNFILDETNGCILHGEYTGHDSSTEGEFYIEFRVRVLNETGVDATDDETFGSLKAAAETALNIPRQTLLVKLGNTEIRNWSFSGSPQTAILIQPRLTILRENCRDHHYAFLVRCQHQGNVPGNVFRRESLTRVRESLRQRRECELSAEWTSSDGVTAYQRYLGSADGFFNTYLPINSHDQYGNRGTWTRANEDPAFNDEVSVITATRLYWEVFAGRRDSTTTQIDTIGDLRVSTIPSTWNATPGFTALQNYLDGGDAFFDEALDDPVTDGEWVLVDERFGFNDQNGELQAIRVYHEVVNGLRELVVRVTEDPAGIRRVVATGTFYGTSTRTAKQNYTNAIDGVIAAAVAEEGITQFESYSVPKVTGYDTTRRRYFFTWTMNELAYPESPLGWDDVNVRLETLDVEADSPFDQQSITSVNPVTRLRVGSARFVAVIDKNSPGGNDPVALWTTKFRLHVVHAILTRLGPGLASVNVTSETVGAGLHANTLVGRVTFLVAGGSVLSCKIIQTVTLVPGREFVDRADGTPFSVRDYRVPPEKLLHREAVIEYVIGSAPPVVFGSGDNAVSGFGMVDTVKTAQESYDDQNAPGDLAFNNWYIDRRSPTPLVNTDVPTTRGDGTGFQTVIHRQVEDWRYVEALEPGTVIT